MIKPKAFLVISKYNEDVSWVKSLTDDYIIYNKGEVLPPEYNQIQLPNFGANQYDIFHYIYNNYNNLPDLIAFMQGNPFDHCLPDRFNKLIYNESFTSLFGDAYYPDGNYFETNDHTDNWYINASFNSQKPPSKFSNFDEYMGFLFEDYTHQNIITFPPGSQLIVEKEKCLFYSQDFWKKLMGIPSDTIGANGGREAHIIERSIQTIFENKYKEKC
jgi:hypothetical protein